MKGACLLDENARLFDHTFVMTGLEVEAMDPSQCEVLGVAYKAFDVTPYQLAFGNVTARIAFGPVEAHTLVRLDKSGLCLA